MPPSIRVWKPEEIDNFETLDLYGKMILKRIITIVCGSEWDNSGLL
jgi:hypothetical protein